MYYFYAKLFDNKNMDYVFENPQKNNFSVIKDGVTLSTLPTKISAIQYRNAILINEALRKLTQVLDMPIISFDYLYFLVGVTEDINYRDLAMKHYESTIVDYKIGGLIYFDLFLDDDQSEWEKVKELYLANGGSEENIKTMSGIIKEFNTPKPQIPTQPNTTPPANIEIK